MVAAWNVSSGGQWVLRAALSDFTGTGGPPIQLSVNPFPARPAVATDGERFLVIWPEAANGAARIRATFLDGSEFTIDDAVSLAAEEIAPIALWNGSGYAVFWQTLEGTAVAVATATGVVESKHAIGGAGRVTSAAIGPAPVLLWLDRRLGLALHAAALGPDWNAADVAVIATMPESIGGGPTFLMDPQIACNGHSFYAAWTAGRGGRYVRIEGTRLAVDGSALDAHVTCELGPPGTCGGDTRIAGSPIYSGCCEVRTDALLAAGSRFVKAWVGPSSRTSHDHQAASIDGDDAASAPFRLEPPRFPLLYGTVAALPNGELVIVSIVNDGVDVRRVAGTRRRAARSN